ncbi:sulfotransferase 1C4-like [Amphiura filiformis]|uniref:sulfotransferase 1C4-like n=1 Tax=Amphiura filiformis TaxID=82378 RepID=UPI003B21CF03
MLFIRKAVDKIPERLEIVNKMKSPRTIKSHLQGHLLPPDVFKKKARIVYVARNPKDMCVSYYYFHIMNPSLPTPKSWNEFFEDFFTGKKKVATFVGYTLSDDVINGIVDHCSFTSMKKNPMTNPDTIFAFTYKKLEQRRKENPSNDGVNLEEPKQERTSFMRKGKVGDWKNHFTVAQNEAFDILVQDKLAGSGLAFEY